VKQSAREGKGGSDSFESYYRELFGARWSSLRAALLEPVTHVAWTRNLLQPYYLDAGSVEAAFALPLPPSGSVLDMCAAPGGKSLVIAGRLPDDTNLVSNEFSRDRKSRLISVLDQHLPPPIRARVTVTGRDASRWSRYEQDAFDSILLDAPCSSERHVLSAPAYLAEWSPARVRNLAQRQWSILSGAWLVLKAGGSLLYSTCALSPAENDDVVARLVKKYNDVEVIDLPDTAEYAAAGLLSRAEKTRFGFHVLPDTANGAGPLYYALVRKMSVTGAS
jgi:16S rRNA C967 or C1407 C5-methylase (RsmB/RsmF family)